MPPDASNKEPFVITTRQLIPRLLVIPRWLVIIFSISLFSLAGSVGLVVYNKVPVEIWGMKIGYAYEGNKSNDIPFLVSEVQQLKEQSQLLEKRLVKLLKENELQKNQLKECKDNSLFNSNG